MPSAVDPAPVGAVASPGPPASLPLLDAAAARAGDEAAVAAGATWSGLMWTAAGHLARGVLAAAGGRGHGLRVVLVVGKGNNGGDGWAAARRLTHEHGAACTVVAIDGTEVEVSAEAAANRAAWLAAGGRTVSGTDHLDALLADADVAVDAVLGTGSRGAPRGTAEAAVEALLRAAAAGTNVVACDLPSGVDADDGSIAGPAVRADLTVTFGALKRGLVLHPGATHAGRILLGSLGRAYDTFAAANASWAALTPAGAAPEPFGPAVDKRARGLVLTVAGAVGTSGAAALAGGGALAAGAGLVTVATPTPARAEVAARSDAGVMVRGLPVTPEDDLDPDAVHALPPLPEPPGAVVAGPGLGTGPGVYALVAALRRRAARLVLDADALNVHREYPGSLAEHRGALVLTPHERELARIGGGEDGADAWAHRVVRVPELAAALDATIVAKGPGTLIAAPDGRVWVTPVGGPALGSGGTGDVLAGVLGAAIAGATDVPLAVARAVWWHAAAGALAGATRAGRATATDLLATLPQVLARLAVTERPVTHRVRRGPGAVRMAAPWGALPWEAWLAPGEERG
jgi:ADP-dependent NAD(P)H-hydrate dehydratase / NAD(P)H-hydrate epimerase